MQVEIQDQVHPQEVAAEEPLVLEVMYPVLLFQELLQVQEVMEQQLQF
jgi:hypothetical protein